MPENSVFDKKQEGCGEDYEEETTGNGSGLVNGNAVDSFRLWK